MILNLIRHGKTAGNIGKKYIGMTDEPLCPEGIAEIKKISYPACDTVISSPMKRCIQTAEIICPDRKIFVRDDLKECNFGDFEGKNYAELSGNPDYQMWIESNGTATFPNGENPADFRKRCCNAFLEIFSEYNNIVVSMIVHGGTIMSIMSEFAVPHKDFFDWHVKNGRGFTVEYFSRKIAVLEEI
ncbi:MAG: histidine phosphatase family protein [Ruminococcus sp.]|nr:histidine phosphatase family protein [Ruminococcus sp.]